MFRAEIVIDFRVDLLPGKRAAGAEDGDRAVVFAARPIITSGIRAVANGVVVGRWHNIDQFRDVPGRIERFAKWIPIRARLHKRGDIRAIGGRRWKVCRQFPEHARIAKGPGERRAVWIRGGRDGIAKPIYNCDGWSGAGWDRWSDSVAVVPAVE